MPNGDLSTCLSEETTEAYAHANPYIVAASEGRSDAGSGELIADGIRASAQRHAKMQRAETAERALASLREMRNDLATLARLEASSRPAVTSAGECTVLDRVKQWGE